MIMTMANDNEPFLECFHQKFDKFDYDETTEAINLHNMPKLSFDEVLIYDTYLLPLLICKQHTFRIINPRPTNFSANGILANHHQHSLITRPVLVPALFKRLLIDKLPENSLPLSLPWHTKCHLTYLAQSKQPCPVLSCLPNYLHTRLISVIV